MILIKSEEKKKLLGNVISLFVLQGSNYIIPLFSIPFLFKRLDVEKFGLVNFAFAFMQYFIILTDFGYNLSATKSIAEHREDKQKTQLIFNSVMGSKFLLFLTGFLVLLCIVFFIPDFSVNKNVFILSYGMVLGNVLFPIWFFQGIEKMKMITWLTICLKLVAIVPLFFLVKSSSDYLYVPFLNSLAWLACGIVSLYIIKKDFGISPGLTTIPEIKQSLKESSPFFLSRVSASIYTVSNAFALGIFSGNVAVGFYTAAEKLFQALLNAYSPINSSLYPFMTKHKDLKLFKKIFFAAVAFNLILIATLLFFSNDIITLFYKKSAVESVLVFRLLLIACCVVVPSVLIGFPLLAALGYSNFANRTVIAPSILHLVGLGILVLTHSFNIYTVAGMVIFTESLVLLSRVYGVFKYKLFSIKPTIA